MPPDLPVLRPITEERLGLRWTADGFTAHIPGRAPAPASRSVFVMLFVFVIALFSSIWPFVPVMMVLLVVLMALSMGPQPLQRFLEGGITDVTADANRLQLRRRGRVLLVVDTETVRTGVDGTTLWIESGDRSVEVTTRGVDTFEVQALAAQIEAMAARASDPSEPPPAALERLLRRPGAVAEGQRRE